MTLYGCVRAPGTAWLFLKELVAFAFFLWALSLVLRFFATVAHYSPWFFVWFDGRFWTPSFWFMGLSFLILLAATTTIFLFWCLCCYITRQDFSFQNTCAQCADSATARYRRPKATATFGRSKVYGGGGGGDGETDGLLDTEAGSGQRGAVD